MRQQRYFSIVDTVSKKAFSLIDILIRILPGSIPNSVKIKICLKKGTVTSPPIPWAFYFTGNGIKSPSDNLLNYNVNV